MSILFGEKEFYYEFSISRIEEFLDSILESISVQLSPKIPGLFVVWLLRLCWTLVSVHSAGLFCRYQAPSAARTHDR